MCVLKYIVNVPLPFVHLPRLPFSIQWLRLTHWFNFLTFWQTVHVNLAKMCISNGCTLHGWVEDDMAWIHSGRRHYKSADLHLCNMTQRFQMHMFVTWSRKKYIYRCKMSIEQRNWNLCNNVSFPFSITFVLF